MDAEKEKKLVEASKKDASAFGALFEEYYPKILKYTVYRTGNAEVARDVTSETFFKALKNIGQFRWMGASFSSWLYRIASNEVNMYFRHRKYEPSSLDAALEDNPNLNTPSKQELESEVMEAQSLIERNREYMKIKEELLKLPVIYQEALTLRFFQEMKISEIAGVLHKKDGTVKSLISRGLGLLKTAMQPNDRTVIIWSESIMERQAD